MGQKVGGQEVYLLVRFRFRFGPKRSARAAPGGDNDGPERAARGRQGASMSVHAGRALELTC
eukprot:CAMPEP_0115854974 /NCGR_PEP_ID=MMETSP0287-20121206/14304_1 /TAXON_ID=412157 /ORGANISM="Chrysochromulina rotalis, Strain UIO044" /LENGTH=61 /DNA_ID=CAMNT_0003309115 /DNA_START=135 /DNA_END=320 /DNA_ORIENTATION=+